MFGGSAASRVAARLCRNFASYTKTKVTSGPFGTTVKTKTVSGGWGSSSKTTVDTSTPPASSYFPGWFHRSEDRRSYRELRRERYAPSNTSSPAFDEATSKFIVSLVTEALKNPEVQAAVKKVASAAFEGLTKLGRAAKSALESAAAKQNEYLEAPKQADTPKLESGTRKPDVYAILGVEKKCSNHKLLGVAEDASLAEVKAAYHKLVKQWHPDQNKHMHSAAVMRKLNKAFNALERELKE
eukprot:gnl/Spiro4/22317_TR10989_c0_g1_i1.p2 gnl/Spiro4/22317_TR10989_c0_g1~~gnl/Spiro4/22317_TR10989_c0_g1_i1.p2  ORF type:complete len:253 (+),score=54.21 gnl/Spiro4/22317_TR10989_c0_g1_i1:38-760(+)